LGKKGSQDGEFISICGIAVYFSDVYVTDSIKCDIQKFTNWQLVDSELMKCLGSGAGNSFHSLPSSSLPVALDVIPPHCLKKNGTFAFIH
jgi:hypothetical protein